MCWIIPLIVGVLSALLGYWFGKDNQPSVDEMVLDNLRTENKTLQKDFTKETTKKALFIEKAERLIQDYKEGILEDELLFSGDASENLEKGVKKKEVKTFFIERAEALLRDFKEGKAKSLGFAKDKA